MVSETLHTEDCVSDRPINTKMICKIVQKKTLVIYYCRTIEFKDWFYINAFRVSASFKIIP